MIRVKSALDAWWALASIFSGGMLGLFLLAYLTIVIGTTVIFLVGFLLSILIPGRRKTLPGQSSLNQ